MVSHPQALPWFSTDLRCYRTFPVGNVSALCAANGPDCYSFCFVHSASRAVSPIRLIWAFSAVDNPPGNFHFIRTLYRLYVPSIVVDSW